MTDFRPAMTRVAMAQEIAAEHCAWARNDGQNPRELMAAFGEDDATAGWPDAERALVRVWLGLRRAL